MHLMSVQNTITEKPAEKGHCKLKYGYKIHNNLKNIT